MMKHLTLFPSAPTWALVLFSCFRLTAQNQPENDFFVDSSAITGAVVMVTGANVAATKEPGENAGSNVGGHSVWWTWTAPSNGTYMVDTSGSSFDTFLGVWSGGSLAGLTKVAENDDAYTKSYFSRCSFTATSNHVYHFRVDGYNSGTWPSTTNELIACSGNIVLNVRPGLLPTIAAHPKGVTNTSGSSLTLQVSATSAQSFQWYKDGNAIPEGKTQTYYVASAQATDSGIYYAAAINAAGSSLSSNAQVVIGPVVIKQQPKSLTVASGYSMAFSVTAAGTLPISYQWFKDGGQIAGATSTNLIINEVRPEDAGIYSVLAASTAGSVLSSNAALTVQDFTFSTLAGLPGISGGTDGRGCRARFRTPSGIALDRAGNVYVTEYGNHTIRQITPDGEVTTIAGLARVSGAADGPGSAARFNNPEDIVVDANTNLYVTDNFNYTIRRILPSGTGWEVSTLAGVAGIPGLRDGPGAQALFRQPCGLVLDSKGFVYVSEWGNRVVRRIRPDGYVSTFGSKFTLSDPNGVTIDAADNLYITSEQSGTITKVTPHGIGTVVGNAGRGSYGATLDEEGSFWLCSRLPYFDSPALHTVRKLEWEGEWGTIAGGSSAGFQDGAGGTARFDSFRNRMVFDSKGTIYLTDYSNHVIRKGVPVRGITAPKTQAVPIGTEVNLSAQGQDGCTFEWSFDGRILPGQTGSTLALGPVVRSNSGPYSVTISQPDGSLLSFLAMVRALVPPVLLPPQVLTNGTVRLLFRDADGGLPYDVNKTRVEWTTNLTDTAATNWQILGQWPAIANGFIQVDHVNAVATPIRIYRIEEH